MHARSRVASASGNFLRQVEHAITAELLAEMTDDDDPIEVPLPALAVAETHLLFRLAPAAADYLQPSIQTALVPADSEDDTRRIATATDPLGHDWRDPTRFVAHSIVTADSHVVGDIIFKSVPTGAKLPKSERR